MELTQDKKAQYGMEVWLLVSGNWKKAHRTIEQIVSIGYITNTLNTI